jgi:hypothetical protein
MKYQVLLAGENYEINWEGGIQNCGFITTRLVKASTVDEAKTKAVELIKSDISLKSMMVENPTCLPKVYVEEVSVAKWWKKSGGKGYSFYKMDAD